MNYEVRKIDRPIEECNLREQAAFGNSGATNKPMIADPQKVSVTYVNPGNFKARKAQLWRDLAAVRMTCDTISAEAASDRKATQAAIADAMGKPFDPVACRAQFDSECA